ncbi:MAG: hypothetical protein DI585_02315 [Pseudomonas fluorescens]|nr:MAG: hypothetical protein DI585_02315 [Pseudomonas fluorescens]
MIAQLAEIYVNLIEPGIKILLVVIVVAFIVYGFNMLRGGKANEGVVGAFVTGLVKLVVKVLKLIGRGFLAFMGFAVRTFKLLFATVRDFFRSQDL